MSEGRSICIICAYRGTCQKQFSLKAGQRCLEFARDLAIKEEKEEDTKLKAEGEKT